MANTTTSAATVAATTGGGNGTSNSSAQVTTTSRPNSTVLASAQSSLTPTPAATSPAQSAATTNSTRTSVVSTATSQNQNNTATNSSLAQGSSSNGSTPTAAAPTVQSQSSSSNNATGLQTTPAAGSPSTNGAQNDTSSGTPPASSVAAQASTGNNSSVPTTHSATVAPTVSGGTAARGAIGTTGANGSSSAVGQNGSQAAITASPPTAVRTTTLFNNLTLPQNNQSTQTFPGSSAPGVAVVPSAANTSSVSHQNLTSETQTSKAEESTFATNMASLNASTDAANTSTANVTTIEANNTMFETNSTIIEPNSTTIEPNSTTIEPNSTTIEPNSTTIEPNSTTTFELPTSTPEPLFNCSVTGHAREQICGQQRHFGDGNLCGHNNVTETCIFKKSKVNYNETCVDVFETVCNEKSQLLQEESSSEETTTEFDYDEAAEPVRVDSSNNPLSPIPTRPSGPTPPPFNKAHKCFCTKPEDPDTGENTTEAAELTTPLNPTTTTNLTFVGNGTSERNSTDETPAATTASPQSVSVGLNQTAAEGGNTTSTEISQSTAVTTGVSGNSTNETVSASESSTLATPTTLVTGSTDPNGTSLTTSESILNETNTSTTAPNVTDATATIVTTTAGKTKTEKRKCRCVPSMMGDFFKTRDRRDTCKTSLIYDKDCTITVGAEKDEGMSATCVTRKGVPSQLPGVNCTGTSVDTLVKSTLKKEPRSMLNDKQENCLLTTVNGCQGACIGDVNTTSCHDLCKSVCAGLCQTSDIVQRKAGIVVEELQKNNKNRTVLSTTAFPENSTNIHGNSTEGEFTVGPINATMGTRSRSRRELEEYIYDAFGGSSNNLGMQLSRLTSSCQDGTCGAAKLQGDTKGVATMGVVIALMALLVGSIFAMIFSNKNSGKHKKQRLE